MRQAVSIMNEITTEAATDNMVRSWENCDHEWKDIDAMADNEVRCIRCGVTGARISDTEVYWPAT